MSLISEPAVSASTPESGKYIACEGFADSATYYSGRLIGRCATRIEAEELLNGYVYDLFLTDQLVLIGDLIVYTI